MQSRWLDRQKQYLLLTELLLQAVLYFGQHIDSCKLDKGGSISGKSRDRFFANPRRTHPAPYPICARGFLWRKEAAAEILPSAPTSA
jgi:hypothetical protein